MKKKILFIILSVLIIAGLTACSVKSEDAAGTTESTINSTVSESTTEKEETESETETTTQKSENSETTTTTKPAEQKSAGQTTTKKVTTTQKQTTTKNQTTTKKVTTTQKQTTTKKTTTTSFEWDCNVDGHSCDVGPIGWVNSFDAATDKALEYIASHDTSGNFRVMQCHNCGKYTAEITLR